MCGLAGFVIRDECDARMLERLTDELLQGINHRGGDATGYVAIGGGQHQLIKAALPAPGFCKGRPALPRTVRGLIGHTRFATQGSTAWGWNNHPVRVGDTYLAHNGHVWNQAEVAKGLDHQPFAEVDSALLAAMADQYGTIGVLDEWHKVEGDAAVTYWSPKTPDTIVLARIHGTPLNVWVGRKAVVWASEAWVVRDAWKRATGGAGPDLRKVRTLDEGDAVLVKVDTGETERRRFKAPAPVYRHTTRWDNLPKVTLPKGKGHGKASKGKRSGGGTGAGVWLPKGKGDATASPTGILRVAPDALMPEVWTPEGHSGRCDGCDYWETVTEQTIGGETFAMCEACADWARRTLG